MSAHSNLVQINEAFGRNIHQSQNADINVVAQSGSHHHNPHWYGHNQGHEYGHHHGGYNHHGHNHHGHNHGYNNGADAQVNVIQSNHASGNNIHQVQNADVNVVAQNGHTHHWSGRYQADHGADAQVNVIQSNQASGNNIHQAQNADVNVFVRDAFHGHNSWAPTHPHSGYDAGYGQGYVGGYEHGHAYDSGAYNHGHSGDYGCDVSILPINPGC